MRFVLTLNMPNKEGRPTATMHVEHDAENMGEFLDYLNENTFIEADEMYQDNKTGQAAVSGSVIVNTNLIGKVKAYVDDNNFNTR